MCPLFRSHCNLFFEYLLYLTTQKGQAASQSSFLLNARPSLRYANLHSALSSKGSNTNHSNSEPIQNLNASMLRFGMVWYENDWNQTTATMARLFENGTSTKESKMAAIWLDLEWLDSWEC